ncbi:uncharacterized protein LOC131842193 [Achroia grisella]|uniref:uncharacterized protein LOC131842193 n=1 Tax=Achroia grisella TaxID=688607 RepID=UPI0027D33EDE|nr:uncharacterized protein LOC131842193 [Achroia grisella]
MIIRVPILLDIITVFIIISEVKAEINNLSYETDDGLKQAIITKKFNEYVITSKPYSNVRIYTPRAVMIAKILQMDNIRPYIEKPENIQFLTVTGTPFTNFVESTINPFVNQIHRQTGINKLKDIVYNKPKFEEMQNDLRDDTVSKNTETNNYDDLEISTDMIDNIGEELSETNDTGKEISHTEKFEMKSLSISGLGEVTDWSDKHISSDVSNEMMDNNEFIFIKDQSKKSGNLQLLDNLTADDTTLRNFVTDDKIRLKRNSNINIIQEENLGSTVAGFKFTGSARDARSQGEFIFKNVHV